MAANAGADLAIGDALDLERMQFAEFRDLVESQRRVLHQPDSGGLRHERGVAHRFLLESLLFAGGRASRAPARPRLSLKVPFMTGIA